MASVKITFNVYCIIENLNPNNIKLYAKTLQEEGPEFRRIKISLDIKGFRNMKFTR